MSGASTAAGRPAILELEDEKGGGYVSNHGHMGQAEDNHGRPFIIEEMDPLDSTKMRFGVRNSFLNRSKVDEIRQMQKSIFLKQSQLLNSSSEQFQFVDSSTDSSFDTIAKAFEARENSVKEIVKLVMHPLSSIFVWVT
eukprot:TRINITY_DN20866_c0_g1_i7.p1 TRINITY_DN20866_c0_g1~~TRINITY_DN20866_c0_g1_i7.p1  ORF type:complete len:154 (-),score=41.44 TRINITY_DN20866_c0_g1_i7:104-520(-)